MIAKIDIDKAFNTVEWNAILAILQKMNFPGLWISWIYYCLSSASFSFLINGHSSSWISSNRGVRQGDPISPLIFILVTQNLFAILNQVLFLNLVLGFDHRLSKNFNHLMLADNLILVTMASTSAAQNCTLCLDIYHKITGHKPNLDKSALFLPSWCNKKIAKALSILMGIKLDKLPFTYLGVLISPSRLSINNFNFWLNRVEAAINSWYRLSISFAGHMVLINSSIFSLPTYLLSMFLIPDSILEKISKLAKNFLWGRNGNRSGFHTIG